MKESKVSLLHEKISNLVESPSFPLLSSLERDLLLQHLRDMYEEVLSLDTKTVQSEEAPVVNVETVTSKVKKHDTLSFKKILHPNQNLLIGESVTTPEIKAPKAEVPIQKKESRTEPAVNAGTINDRIPDIGSLNQKLKSGSGKEVHKILSSKPLRELIDLNKRFALVNELFKGNAEAFTTAVNRIDSFREFGEAEKFISEELSAPGQWDSSAQTTRLFLKLVKQRFGVE